MELFAQSQWESHQRLCLRVTTLLFLSWSTAFFGAFSWASRQIYLVHSCKAIIPGGWSSASWQGGHLAACRQEGYIRIDNTVGSNSLVTLLFFVISIHTLTAARLTQHLKARQWGGCSLEKFTAFGIGCTSLFDLNGVTSSCISPGTEQGMATPCRVMAHSLAVPSLPAHSSDFLLGFTPPSRARWWVYAGQHYCSLNFPFKLQIQWQLAEYLVHSQNIYIPHFSPKEQNQSWNFSCYSKFLFI